MKLSGRCVQVCIKFQEASWACGWYRCSQGSWYCCLSLVLFKFSPGGLHNVPVHPKGATTTRWALSELGWDFYWLIPWGLGSYLPLLYIFIRPSFPCPLVGWVSLFPKSLVWMKYLWGTVCRARWGPWGVVLCIRVNLVWGKWTLVGYWWFHVRWSWGPI